MMPTMISSVFLGPGIKCGLYGTRVKNLNNLRRHLKNTCEGNLEQHPKRTSPGPALSTGASSVLSGKVLYAAEV